MNVLDRITQLRMEKGWTEYELAKNADMPQSTISNWYGKHQLPSILSLEKICKGFGVTLSYFFCEGDEAIILTPEQKELLDQWVLLSDNQREKLKAMIDGMLTK